jgi:hypothetical protein
MQLDGAYEFLELTQADGILVSSAREKGTGKLVQIHLFPAERSQDANQICQNIMGLPDAARRMVIKFGKDGTSTYFITEALPAGEGIRGWIAGQMGRASEPAPAPPPPPPPKEGPGEFTRMYTQQDLSSGSQASAPAAPVPVTPAPKAPGEFTRMYTAQEIRDLTASFRPPAPESRPTPPPEPPPQPAARDAAPGLETFIFERSSVTRPAPVIPPRPQAPPPTPPPPPPPQQPVYSRPEPIEPSPLRQSNAMRDTFEAPQPIFAPTPPPSQAQAPAPVAPLPPAHARVEAPRAPAARFDWKIALLLAAALLVLVAIVIAIVG